MTTDKKYTLIAYKPSSSGWEGCNCHGESTNFDSDLQVEQDLTEEELKQFLTSYADHHLDKGEDGYEYLIFENGRLAFIKGEHIQATPDNTEYENRYGYEEDLKKEQKARDERMLRIFAESAAKVTAEKEARAKEEEERKAEARRFERIQQQRRQEEQERLQLAALQAKYGSKS